MRLKILGAIDICVEKLGQEQAILSLDLFTINRLIKFQSRLTIKCNITCLYVFSLHKRYPFNQKLIMLMKRNFKID